MFRPIPHLLACLLLSLSGWSAFAQAADDAVRVTVTMNPDGSKTVYQNDGAKHQTTATTTGRDGKARDKIIYHLDASGRYETGRVFGPDGALRFKTRYQYDPSGRLAEETQAAKDDSVRHKIVYSYDAAGHQAGYAIYDGGGKLLGKTTAKDAPASGSPSPRR